MRNRTFPLLSLLLVLVVPCQAVNPLISGVVNRTAGWPPQAGSSYTFGGPFEVAWQAVPTSLTDLSTNNIHIIELTVANTTGSPITLTFQTKDVSPLALPLAGSIPANTSVSFNIPAGILSKGGASIQAGGAGLNFHCTWSN